MHKSIIGEYMAVKLEKKVNTSISVRESTLEQLREHRKKHGVSVSWLVDTLLHNYLDSWKELKYDEEV